MRNLRARLAVALLVAALLHVALLLAVLRAPAPRQAAVRPPLVVELLQRAPRPPAPPVATPAPPVTPAPPAIAHSGRPASRSSAPALPPAAPAAPGSGSGPLALTPEVRAEEGLGGPPLSLELKPSAPATGAEAGDGHGGLVVPKSREQALAEEKAEVSRRVQNIFGDKQARLRAETPDHYWADVERLLGRGFDPGWDVLDKGPDPASTASAFLKSWQKQAEAYGKTGSPLPPGERGDVHAEIFGLANAERGLGSTSLEGGPNFGINVALAAASAAAEGKLWHHRLVASIRITQHEDGSIFTVQLLGSSGNAAYDRLAVARARALDVRMLGKPKQSLETLWAFESDFSQIPPAPIAGCALDDFIPKNCWYPLKKMVKSRVRLEAIY